MRLAPAIVAALLLATPLVHAQNAPAGPSAVAPAGPPQAWTGGYSPSPSTPPPPAFLIMSATGESTTLEGFSEGEWVPLCVAPCQNVPLDPRMLYRVGGKAAASGLFRLPPGLRRLDSTSGTSAGRSTGASLLIAAPILGFSAFVDVVANDGPGGSPWQQGLLGFGALTSFLVGLTLFVGNATNVNLDGVKVGERAPMTFVF